MSRFQRLVLKALARILAQQIGREPISATLALIAELEEASEEE
jgi:hypothetical protein